jgi:hypothetical protein
MLPGKKLFDGETVSDILAAVLKEEPDWSSIPVEVRRLLGSCLKKDPKQRLHDISDRMLLLDDVPALHRPRDPGDEAAALDGAKNRPDSRVVGWRALQRYRRCTRWCEESSRFSGSI